MERGILRLTNLYIALDFPNWEKTQHFLQTNQLKGVPVKIGMELFYHEGPTIIEQLKEMGHSIFLDLKLHDISNTVYHAMKNLAKLEVDLVNVHALGGLDMINKAKDGLQAGATSSLNRPKLLAVTILTSMTNEKLHKQLHIKDSLDTYVNHLAKMSKQAGADGVVCSAQEAKQIKQVCGDEFLTVTPGIRLASDETQDQKRVTSPKFAKKNGADILVVGRPITQAKHPKKIYEQIKRELESYV